MGRSFFRELLDDDSDEDEIIIKLLMGETSQRKRRRLSTVIIWQAINGFMMTTLLKNLYILPKYFEGDFE